MTAHRLKVPDGTGIARALDYSLTRWAARMNGHDPYAYQTDILTRLPTHPNNRIEELLPHRWQPETA